MADQVQEWAEETLAVAGTELTLISGGSGRPLLVLHEELGHPGWFKWHAALAANRRLLIPQQPGFGKSPKLDWTRSIRGPGRLLLTRSARARVGADRRDRLFAGRLDCGRNGGQPRRASSAA